MPETDPCGVSPNARLADIERMQAPRGLAHAGAHDAPGTVPDAPDTRQADMALTCRAFPAHGIYAMPTAMTWYDAALAANRGLIRARSHMGQGRAVIGPRIIGLIRGA